MNNELVSIITPAYKAQHTILETIKSVQAQEYVNWEMLIIDDGSPDSTSEIVAQAALDDPRVRLIRQKNAGPAMARQKALDNANGRYIAFLDSDDLWLPQKLQRQLAFMSNKNVIFSYTSFRRIRSDGSGLGRRIRIPVSLDYNDLLGNTAIATSTVIIDRKEAGELRMTKTYYDDFVLWLGLLKRGHRAYGLDEDLMRYRVIAQSVSRNKKNSARMVWKTYREIEKLSLLASIKSFAFYAFNAWRKYRVF
ncbi:glycosyltransferase family 2 protein [Methylophilus methylotrophus]|uniref:glycosyltransferase family 2 protein n=1 Tax=Methylophilus methylotrophus TaxID=17 RepID=UPI000F5A4BC6|nr:glycosyltransferase family 2 protein [Methylophilus methylotrophus]